MQDGTMFGQLEKYQKSDFRNENPYIYFDTLAQRHTYEIVYVIRTTATVGEGFPYHSYIDFENEDQFNSFTKQCRRLRYYDSGVSVEYGDKLICLSTCWYTMTNGRFVVIAKQVA
jgi:sortase B